MNKLLKTALVPILLVVSLGITLLAANAASITSSVRDEHTTTKKEYAQATTYHERAGVRTKITINSVGERYVRAAIPIKGYITSGVSGARKRLVLQQFVSGKWRMRDIKFQRKLGAYTFPSRKVAAAGTARFRTLVYVKGKLVAKSNTLRVKVIKKFPGTPTPTPPTPTPPTPTPTVPVPPDPTPTTPPPAATCATAPSPTTCPQPQSIKQERTIEENADCQKLKVARLVQEWVVDWVWSPAALAWVKEAPDWQTVDTVSRDATFDECIDATPGTRPAGALLPDIVAKSLVKCGGGDMTATGGDCFMQTTVNGRRLLKFPVITLNVGDGPSEIIADRTAADAEDWAGYQVYYNAAGENIGSREKPHVQFYFAGDGHNHWHIRDFDYYRLLNLDGSEVTVNRKTVGAEKHGYCLQDNTTYGPMEGQPGVPPGDPTRPSTEQGVYWETTSCGKGLPAALEIVHGLSKGWGDTYPSSLPDQAIDITNVPPGEYIVEVHVDERAAVDEKSDANNVARVHVVIGAPAGASDGIQVLSNTACGGVDDTVKVCQ